MWAFLIAFVCAVVVALVLFSIKRRSAAGHSGFMIAVVYLEIFVIGFAFAYANFASNPATPTARGAVRGMLAGGAVSFALLAWHGCRRWNVLQKRAQGFPVLIDRSGEK